MAFNPLQYGLPRRYLYLISFSVILILVSLLSTPTTRQYVAPSSDSSYHPINWLPDLITENLGFSGSLIGGKPEEWDEMGRCLFMSPFDALSKSEKERANQVALEQVSSGIVTSRKAIFHPSHALASLNSTSSKSKKPTTETLSNPILGLIRDGERKWQDLVNKQSKTFKDAVEEYKVRWNMNPPKGFDLWYVFKVYTCTLDGARQD
jgi:beta-1,2-xylosyltransferase